MSPDKPVARLALPLVGDGSDARSEAALAMLREQIIPQTVGRVTGAEASVSGQTAQSRDFNDLMKGNAPIVLAFVLSMAFALLLFTFRSIVVPIKAILLNLLSVGAAYGVPVYVFQEGHGERLLGFESTGPITSWLPLFLCVILFGLSMDYHAVAVLVDATIVRAVLLPATMKLLGDWNWYLPKGLRRMPQIAQKPARQPR